MFERIIAEIDVDVVNMMKQIRQQAVSRQKGSLELVGRVSSTPIIDLVPPSSDEEHPKRQKMRGRLEQSPRRFAPNRLRGICLGASSMLVERLQIAQDVQVALTPNEEEAIVLAPVEDMVSAVVELMSCSLIISRAIRTEVQKNSAVAIEKVKA